MSVHEEMVSKLKALGQNHSFAALGSGVVIVGPGVPFSVQETSYQASELDKAVEAGKLERRKLSGSITLDTYGAK